MIRNAGWLLCALAAVGAAQPRLVNAKLETHALQGTLEETFKRMVAAQTDPAWIGYAVPVVPGDRHMCCYYSNSDENYSYRGCSLEPRSPLPAAGTGNASPVLLEAPKNFYVMFRAERNELLDVLEMLLGQIGVNGDVSDLKLMNISVNATSTGSPLVGTVAGTNLCPDGGWPSAASRSMGRRRLGPSSDVQSRAPGSSRNTARGSAAYQPSSIGNSPRA